MIQTSLWEWVDSGCTMTGWSSPRWWNVLKSFQDITNMFCTHMASLEQVIPNLKDGLSTGHCAEAGPPGDGCTSIAPGLGREVAWTSPTACIFSARNGSTSWPVCATHVLRAALLSIISRSGSWNLNSANKYRGFRHQIWPERTADWRSRGGEGWGEGVVWLYFPHITHLM